MDKLDIALLRELTQAGTVWPANPHLSSSHRAIARKLGVSAGTVRNRVLRMTRSGFLQGIRVYANPGVLGLLSGSYTLETPPGSRRGETIARLSQVEGIVFFENFHGSLLGLGVVAEDEAGMQRLLAEIDKAVGSKRGTYTPVHHPPCAVRPTEAEWALLSRIVPDGFRSYRELSSALGVPIRTLKRRVARLARGGALLSFPRLDYRALNGGITAELLISYVPGPAKDACRAKVLNGLEPWMTYAGVWEEFEVYRLILPNPSVGTELAETLAADPGVAMSRFELVDGVYDRFESLLPHIARRCGRRYGTSPGPLPPSSPSRSRQRAGAPRGRSRTPS